MVELLKRVCDGSNPYDVGAGLRGVAYEAIGGMQHRSDRETMHAIILLLSNDPASVQTAAVMDKMRIKR
ncbi:MAG: hypothetical protein QG629_724 [Patescibacteria group bacterium]|nr:hypothetical protein [Patescibacteria group bacterium]